MKQWDDETWAIYDDLSGLTKLERGKVHLVIRARRAQPKRTWISIPEYLMDERRLAYMIGPEQRRRVTDGARIMAMRASDRLNGWARLLEFARVMIVGAATLVLQRVLNEHHSFFVSTPLLGWLTLGVLLGLMALTMVWAIQFAWHSWRMALTG